MIDLVKILKKIILIRKKEILNNYDYINIYYNN